MEEEKKNQETGKPLGKRGFGGKNNRRGGGNRRGNRRDEKPDMEQRILDLARVTRVTAGGKRMSFRAAVVVGDRKGKVGLGVAKGADVQLAVDKAYRQAKKKLVKVPIIEETIPHQVLHKFGSAQILIKPAPKGTGLKSGGAMRVVFELAGVPNAVSKIMNSNNKLNIAKATIAAFKRLRINEKKENEEQKSEKTKEEKIS